jgi:hypothetical protein
MTEAGTTPLWHWRGGLCLGVLAGLVLGGGALGDEPRHPAPVALASAAPNPATASPAPSTAAPANARFDDRQRRMLLLLVMRSAGPLGPYGALGR